ncbi:MAG: alanine racemase [Magnetococcus sp. WYHC-3]
METAIRPTWLEVDLAALVHNHQVARQAAGPDCAVYPVVKADAYGLGAVEVALALAADGAQGFCVALVEEARELREAGIRQPVLLMGGFGPGQETDVADLDLIPLLFRSEDVERLARHRRRDATPQPVFLKVDTGMGRLGCSSEKGLGLVRALDAAGGFELRGVATHLACADEPHRPETRWQQERFAAFLSHPQWRGRSLVRSMANSAGLLAHPETRMQLARPGIMLYGVSPFHPGEHPSAQALRPVVTWRTRVVQIRHMAPGSSVGYGGAFRVARPSRIGILPVGYADGYSRRLGGRGAVLVAGGRAPVVGRVSMDLTAVDLTAFPQVGSGDEVILLGGKGPDALPVEQLADWMDTIPYEVLCGIGKRVPRLYLPSPA